ncbi:PTS system, glucose/glucosamine/beta-glucoside-specific, IICBA component [Mesomycoplasma dispar]|uniref:PTS system, glucose/glucosamine/beta-glucoside-specific, IICBA component n=1 Tax=Mesomycoplasma dispar TaxID=86660 RepID=A0AAJ5NS14_9BACT|nr:PTS transporter subunit IIABC [Mesomycoplasma dispar]AJR11974.1 protein-N(pi)-phosphohistidine--sugar phosphotransferase [Mesomycoplasma dispar]VEU61257.1 PTS system, glucose/glucosamine/beta-glucoside-specific, IICBA component [Mesomycoplasma dispar]
MSISLKSIFSEKQKKSANNSGASKMRKILSKLSGAFMLPISVMSIAGLLLGIGAAIANNAESYDVVKGITEVNIHLKRFGSFIQMLGEPVFAALPLLFAAAFVIAFTDEAGVAVFSAIIGFLVFIAIQSVFISDVENDTVKKVVEKVIDTKSLGIDEKKDLTAEIIKKILDAKKNEISTELIKKVKETKGVQILFSGAGRDPEGLSRLVGSSLGFRSLQTSVFGGIAVGLTVQFLYNRFHTIQLPQMISFFGGKRFVSLITIPAMALLAFVFLIFWPWVGIALNLFGASLAKVPFGIESFIFGYIERSLIPFGLHHVFYAPLWYSQAGGDAGATITEWALKEGIEVVSKGAGDFEVVKKAGAINPIEPGESLKTLLIDIAKNKDKFVGDSTASTYLLRFANTIDYTKDGKEFSIPLFKFLENNGFKVGRFADGKFSGMMFGLPAAAAAMIMAAPKENRKVASGTVIPAAATSFVTGVTEPIEFTFLFLSPLLFWGFHALMMAFSFMFANLAGVHVPMVFSGGVLDLLIYGAIPVQKGTNFWWVLVVGLAYAPIYYFVFLFFIKWKNLETPGRGENTKLFTKSDYLARKDQSKGKNVDPQVLAIVQGYGGIDNITIFNNCASRLRYDVKDLSLVDEQKLKSAGVVAIKVEGQHHVQAILGPIAEQMNAKINSQRELIKSLSESEINEILQNKPKKVQISVENQCNCGETCDCNTPHEVFAPATGELIELAQVNDGVFSESKLGQGFAIRIGKAGKKDIFSPITGQVRMVFATKHALGFSSLDGKTQILMHIGVDTVELEGHGIEVFVDAGQEIQAGDKVATVDLDYLTNSGITNTDVIVVVLHESKQKDFKFAIEPQRIDFLPLLVGKSENSSIDSKTNNENN